MIPSVPSLAKKMAARDSDDSVDFTDEGELAEVNSLVKKIFDILNRETSRVRKEKKLLMM